MSTTNTRWRSKLAVRRGLLAYARRQAAYWRKKKARAKRHTDDWSHAGSMLADREKKVAQREEQVAAAQRVLARNTPKPLRERAYLEAMKLVGVMEHGGNNVGAAVEQIIREGGGVRGQAWCGWFMAAVYKRAGSKAISWQMGAVRLWLGIAGVRRTSKPKRGDVVRFTFDHMGMFVRDRGDGTIETIEGNTGASGAVSDSATGGDGVYRKTRSKSLVRDYLQVYR